MCHATAHTYYAQYLIHFYKFNIYIYFERERERYHQRLIVVRIIYRETSNDINS